MRRLVVLAGVLCLAAVLTVVGFHTWFSSGKMRVVFFQAGAADAILIRTKQSAVLIDTGLEDNAQALVQALKKEGVRSLDALIVTHFDKDHIGGAQQILETFSVAMVLEPDYTKDAKTYKRYRQALEESHAQRYTLSSDASFTLDGASYRVDATAASSYEKDESNNFSLVVTVQWGDTSFLLTGDAQEARLDELLKQGVAPCDVLKVPHHGRKNDRSAEFFAAASPKIAVITSDLEEPEDQEVVAALEAVGAQVYLTREGTVVCVSDGKRVRVSQEN